MSRALRPPKLAVPCQTNKSSVIRLTQHYAVRFFGLKKAQNTTAGFLDRVTKSCRVEVTMKIWACNAPRNGLWNMRWWKATGHLSLSKERMECFDSSKKKEMKNKVLVRDWRVTWCVVGGFLTVSTALADETLERNAIGVGGLFWEETGVDSSRVFHQHLAAAPQSSCFIYFSTRRTMVQEVCRPPFELQHLHVCKWDAIASDVDDDRIMKKREHRDTRGTKPSRTRNIQKAPTCQEEFSAQIKHPAEEAGPHLNDTWRHSISFLQSDALIGLKWRWSFL